MNEQRERALQALEQAGIAYELVEHAAVYTMEEIDALKLEAKGVECKNLFLRDRNGKRHFLVTVCGDKQVDLKKLRTVLGSSPLSFASEERLEKYLHLTKGSVTPLGILNDKDHAVEVIFDKDLQQDLPIGIHPNDNTATVWVKLEDLVSLIRAQGNSVKLETI